MLADDDGFVNSPKSAMRQSSATMDDLNILIAKKYVIMFDSSLLVIKHWKMNNYIQKDRYTETKYVEQKQTLYLDENKAYTQNLSSAKYTVYGIEIGDVYKVDTQVRLELGKDSIGKDRTEINTTTATTTAPRYADDRDELKAVGYEKVVVMTDRQYDDLYLRMGDTVDDYIARLEHYIVENNANVHNHYATILKWHTEDTKVEVTQK